MVDPGGLRLATLGALQRPSEWRAEEGTSFEWLERAYPQRY